MVQAIRERIDVATRYIYSRTCLGASPASQGSTWEESVFRQCIGYENEGYAS